MAVLGGGRQLRLIGPGVRDTRRADQASDPLPHERGGGSGSWPRVSGTGTDDPAGELLQRIARGDEAAFGQFYDQLSASTYGLVVSVLRDRDQAQEVTQEVFLQVWQSAARFDPGLGSARAWLVTLARRRAVDRVRSAQAAADRDVAVGVRDTVPDYDSVVETVEARFEQQQVRRCLDGLTELQRQAVTLAFYRGYTHREVSELLCVPLGTIKARLRDGLIRLRDCLGVTA